MPRLNFVKKARKAIPSAGIEVGDSYYWWKFRYGGKRVSKTKPRRSALTQSEWYAFVWDLQDDFSCPASLDDLQMQVEELVSQIQDQQSELEDKLSNMPDQLQYAPSGEMIQERIDACESVVSTLESIDLESNIEDLKEEAKEEVMQEVRDEYDLEEDDALDEAQQAVFDSRLQEVVDEKMQELTNEKCSEVEDALADLSI